MEDTKELIPAENRARMAQFLGFAGSLREVTVTGDDEYQKAGELLRQIAGGINTLEDDRKALVAPFKLSAKTIDEEYRTVRLQMENGSDVLRKSMSTWFLKKEAERMALQRKAEAEAAEARRAAEERAAKEAAKADALRAQGKEAQADKAEARAEAAEMQASTVVAAVVDAPVKVAGISYKTTYRVAIDDTAKAIRGMAQDANLVKFLNIDETKLNKYVSALSGDASLPDGLRVVVEKTTVVRRA